MARRACAFKEVDVKRALRAVAAAGLITTCVVFNTDGGFRVEVVANDNRPPRVNDGSDWDAATAIPSRL
jgi:hypothetical protein